MPKIPVPGHWGSAVNLLSNQLHAFFMQFAIIFLFSSQKREPIVMTRWTAFFLSGPWLEESQASFYSSLSSFFGCGKEETNKMALQLLVFYAQTILVRPYSQDKRQQKKLWFDFWHFPTFLFEQLSKRSLFCTLIIIKMFLISLLSSIAGVLLSILKLFERGKVLLVRRELEPKTVAPSQTKLPDLGENISSWGGFCWHVTPCDFRFGGTITGST